MKNKDLKIYLAAPRGFCAGVDRAIEIVKKSINKFGSPVYVRHEIVHNKHVVENLKKIGAIFVEELSEIKDKTRPVIFSAHGVPKKVPKEAQDLKMEYIDATCPLVSKVHREAENLNKAGFHIFLIGHENHPEVVGTMGQIPEGSIELVETIDESRVKGYPICMISGKPIDETNASQYKCRRCSRKMLENEIQRMNNCPLCHMMLI